MFDQYRPEFVQLVRASWWNYWFIAAYILPSVIVLLTGAFFRWGGCVSAPFAWLVFVVAYFFGIQHLDRTINENAVTEREQWLVVSDTGRTFAPITRGIPIGTVYVFTLVIIGRLSQPRFRPDSRNSLRQLSPSYRRHCNPDELNPYNPPSYDGRE